MRIVKLRAHYRTLRNCIGFSRTVKDANMSDNELEFYKILDRYARKGFISVDDRKELLIRLKWMSDNKRVLDIARADSLIRRMEVR